MLPGCEAIARRVFEGGGDGRHGYAGPVVMASGEGQVSSGGQRAAVLVGPCGRPTHAGMVPPWNTDRTLSVAHTPHTKSTFHTLSLIPSFKKKKDFKFVSSFACVKCDRTVAA